MREDESGAAIWFFDGLLLAAVTIAAADRATEPRLKGADRGVVGERVDPDALSARDLRALPGIGPTRAQAIARARWQGLRGGPEAWRAIPGIGDATVEAAARALRERALEPPSERAYTRPDPP